MDNSLLNEPSSILHVYSLSSSTTTTNKSGQTTLDALAMTNATTTTSTSTSTLTLTDVEIEQLPFPLLCGESCTLAGRCVDGALVLTNYRVFLDNGGRHVHIPLGLVDIVEVRDLFYLHISCKDARSFRCAFDNNDSCLEWFRQLSHATLSPRQLQDLFAFRFFSWANEREHEDVMQRLGIIDEAGLDENGFRSEVERLGFDLHGAWRISRVNANYRLCSSYPSLLLVPACVTDATLEVVARFRSARRVPAVVWRHAANGAVIARCSQPEVGWLGWRSAEDEDLLQAIVDACTFDRGHRSTISASAVFSPTASEDSEIVLGVHQLANGENVQPKKVLIMDARSYTTAVANRARGGGCECPEYYPSCDIQFMNLANIHSVRKSFVALRTLCGASADQAAWWSGLEGTRWLHHMSGLLRAAVVLTAAVERDARPVLVHCSDGWDRTPQIVALAQLLLDPFYRTVRGFRILIEREWLAFGHKFADRCGHSVTDDPNERCPVFLQWLDCVHQLHSQFPTAFQFTGAYLVKLAQHTYSRLFGTFLCNTKQDRENFVIGRTFSVWKYLDDVQFINRLYASPATANHVLWPSCNIRDLKLWSDVYIGSLESTSSYMTLSNQTQLSQSLNNGSSPSERSKCVSGNVNTPAAVNNHSAAAGVANVMTKTRSYGDLLVSFGGYTNIRRSSDPNIALEQLNINGLNLNDVNSDASILAPKSDKMHNGCSDDFSSAFESPSMHNGYKLSLSTTQETATTTTTTTEAASVTCEDRWMQHKDINHNGSLLRCTDDDSDGDDADLSEVTVCTNNIIPLATSTQTSTDTLVPENGVSCDMTEVVTTERVDIIQNGTSDGCEVCAQNRKFIGDKQFNHRHQSRSTSGKTSQYSTPPPYSRASSGSGNGPGGGGGGGNGGLDVDGLALLQSDIQQRLRQLHDEFRAREEALQQELHTTRMALIKQVCHNCSYHDNERLDDNYETSNMELKLIMEKESNQSEFMNSLVGSASSIGDRETPGGESLPSDLSWEALDDGIGNGVGGGFGGGMDAAAQQRTLWVPDHAVSRCTGCRTEFWLGRRKHHCRSCGRIFCADCSENSAPLPSEHLFNPVRVCTSCYSALRRSCTQHAPPPAHATTSISTPLAASSN